MLGEAIFTFSWEAAALSNLSGFFQDIYPCSYVNPVDLHNFIKCEQDNITFTDIYYKIFIFFSNKYV
jgi:hypothetical protein